MIVGMFSIQSLEFGWALGVSMGLMSNIMLTCPCSKTGVYRCIFIFFYLV